MARQARALPVAIRTRSNAIARHADSMGQLILAHTDRVQKFFPQNFAWMRIMQPRTRAITGDTDLRLCKFFGRFAQSRALGRKVSDEFTVARLAGEGTKIE